jgi:hypothetical protein
MCDPPQKDCAEAALGESTTDAAATSNTVFMPLSFSKSPFRTRHKRFSGDYGPP